MTPRNIHFAADDDTDLPASPSPRLPDSPLGRLREVTNDPLREYEARPGRVRPLPDGVASLILSRKGRCIIENHQITASIGGVERAYSSKDSLVIAELNGKGIKVNWVANRRSPDCIHLLSANGEYLETLPLKGVAQWFSNDAVSREVAEAAASHRKRDARRLAELHAPDIAAAAERERHNGAELEKKVREDERIVRVFPGAAGHGDTGTRRHGEGFGKADRICAVEEAVNAARSEREQAGRVDVVKEALSAPGRQAVDASEEWA